MKALLDVARPPPPLGTDTPPPPGNGPEGGDGDLSQARVRHLARAARRYPELYGEHEALLLDLAEDMRLDEFKAAIDYWIYLADDHAGEKKADKQQDETRLHASQTSGGMLKLDGLFDKVTGEVILTALDAAMTPEPRANGAGDDLRPASRRRADALHDICRQFLDHHPGRIGGNRPHVSLILDLETLERRAGWRCELGHMGTVTPETARRLLYDYDAELTWLIVDSDAVPLNMGRSARTATSAQLRVLAVRDGGCTWKGCTSLRCGVTLITTFPGNAADRQISTTCGSCAGAITPWSIGRNAIPVRRRMSNTRLPERGTATSGRPLRRLPDPGLGLPE